jgi:acetylornithine deacetylase
MNRQRRGTAQEQDVHNSVQLISNGVDDLRDELIRFLQDLVRIPSLPGQEQEAQRFVAAKLSELRLEVKTVESRLEQLKDHPAFCDDGVPFGHRLNVVGRWAGVGKGEDKTTARSLILNGHIDVVPTGNEHLWADSPWSGNIEAGRLFGRGSCDMKAGIAAAIFAIETLQSLGFTPNNDILLESVIGEETGGVGTLALIVNGYRGDAAIIVEPTELKLCPVQSGALTFRIKVPGRSVHASVKKSGISAFEKFCLLFDAINKLEQHRHISYKNRLYEDPGQIAPINLGTMRGGEWHSTVPNELFVEGRYGVMPGETNKAAKRALADALSRTADGDPWLRDNPPVLEWIEGQFESGQTELYEPILQTLAAAHHNMTAVEPRVRGVTYGSDLRLFTNYAKTPAVLYGPGSVTHAHSVDEFVELEEVIQCTKVLELTAYGWSCGD